VLLRHSLHPAGWAQLRQCSLQHGWEHTLRSMQCIWAGAGQQWATDRQAGRQAGRSASVTSLLRCCSRPTESTTCIT
jgi:hypothetical protein